MSIEKVRQYAIETVTGLLGDIESAAKRGAAVFGAEELLNSVIPSFIEPSPVTWYKPQIGEIYTGERRNLTTLLGCKDWISTLRAIPDRNWMVKAGDYIRLPVKTGAAKYGELKFSPLDIEEADLVVIQSTPDKIILNFEEVLFHSAVNSENTNKGGFTNSALSYYLNANFIETFSPVEKILAKNKNGDRVTLPSLYEVTGDDDYGDDVNWEDEPRQLEYFKKIKNRIRVKDNDTQWWWLSTAAYETTFCGVYVSGSASYGSASTATGGVAPAICIIRPPAP